VYGLEIGVSPSATGRAATPAAGTGTRFVDEDADFHSFTYAKYGRAVLEQPRQFAWQVFDAKVLRLLSPEYGIHRVTKLRAQTLEELAAQLEDVNAEGFLRTVRDGCERERRACAGHLPRSAFTESCIRSAAWQARTA
jgi:hypothetical protein